MVQQTRNTTIKINKVGKLSGAKHYVTQASSTIGEIHKRVDYRMRSSKYRKEILSGFID